MLGIISAAGNALRAFGTVHPAIKWGVVALAGLLAVELLGKEGLDLYAKMATVQSQVNVTNTNNEWEIYNNCLKGLPLIELEKGVNKCTPLRPNIGDASVHVDQMPIDPILTQGRADLPDSLKVGDPSKLSPEDRAKLRSVAPYGNPPPDLNSTK